MVWMIDVPERVPAVAEQQFSMVPHAQRQAVAEFENVVHVVESLRPRIPPRHRDEVDVAD